MYIYLSFSDVTALHFARLQFYVFFSSHPSRRRRHRRAIPSREYQAIAEARRGKRYSVKIQHFRAMTHRKFLQYLKSRVFRYKPARPCQGPLP